MNYKKFKVGVISFQGGVEEHLQALTELGAEAKKVKAPSDLTDLTHLIIPGGESSVIGRFMESSGLSDAVPKLGIPIWGTCAGAIILGRSSSPYSLNLIDVDLDRNAYGSQTQSFKTELKFLDQSEIDRVEQKKSPGISLTSDEKSGEAMCSSADVHDIPAIFIRAPKIAKTGENVKVLASYEDEPVLCQEGKILISTFHPELSHDKSILQYFLSVKNT